MTYSIQEFTGSDADYAAQTVIFNKAWPEYSRSERAHRYEDETLNPEYFFKRFFIVQDGTSLGYFEYMEEWESTGEDDYFMFIAIDPEVDVPAAVACGFDSMMPIIKDRGAVKLSTVIIEDRTIIIDHLKQMGFEFAQRDPRSELDVQAFDLDRFRQLVETLTAEGIEFASMDQLKERFPDWQRRAYDLTWPIVQDIPAPFPHKQEPFEDFAKRYANPRYLPESDFIALDGDEWIGLSNIKKAGDDPNMMSVGLTGMLRSHRRRGIATALKVKTIAFAKQRGVKSIRTDNEENNPMYGLNMQLGFKPKPALLNFGLVIDQK